MTVESTAHCFELLSASQKAELLVIEYIDIIDTFFPGIHTYTEFIEALNSFFRDYQNKDSLKLSPDSIRGGKISCTSAAALVGVWHTGQSPTEPTYFIEQPMRGNEVTKKNAHVVVKILDQQQNSLFIDYICSRGLAVIEADEVKISIPIEGNLNYLRNRIHVFGVESQILTQATARLLASTAV